MKSSMRELSLSLCYFCPETGLVLAGHHHLYGFRQLPPVGRSPSTSGSIHSLSLHCVAAAMLATVTVDACAYVMFVFCSKAWTRPNCICERTLSITTRHTVNARSCIWFNKPLASAIDVCSDFLISTIALGRISESSATALPHLRFDVYKPVEYRITQFRQLRSIFSRSSELNALSLPGRKKNTYNDRRFEKNVTSHYMSSCHARCYNHKVQPVGHAVYVNSRWWVNITDLFLDPIVASGHYNSTVVWLRKSSFVSCFHQQFCFGCRLSSGVAY